MILLTITQGCLTAQNREYKYRELRHSTQKRYYDRTQTTRRYFRNPLIYFKRSPNIYRVNGWIKSKEFSLTKNFTKKEKLAQSAKNNVDLKTDKTRLNTGQLGAMRTLHTLNNELQEKKKRTNELLGKYKVNFEECEQLVKKYKHLPYSEYIKIPECKYNLLLMQRYTALIQYLEDISNKYDAGIIEGQYIGKVLTINNEVAEEYSSEKIEKIVSQINGTLKINTNDYPINISDNDLKTLEEIFEQVTK